MLIKYYPDSGTESFKKWQTTGLQMPRLTSIKIKKIFCTPIFIAALFTIAKLWK
jgi:hypothetical protein